MLSLDSFQNSDTGQAARWGQIIQQYHDSAVQANLPAKPKHDKIGNDYGCIRQYYLSTLAGQRGKRKSFDNTKSYKILKNTTDDGSSIRQCCLSIHFKIQTLARQRGEGKSSNNTTTVR